MMQYAVALLCVLGVAAGQLLFKFSATQLAETNSWMSVRVLGWLLTAFSLYGFTSLVWVWLLQKAELGRVYPLMALAFVLVPAGSYWMFGERFSAGYFFGVAMIMAGIVIAVRS
jgi:drug/metabolite transporter (DMT)-like permease